MSYSYKNKKKAYHKKYSHKISAEEKAGIMTLILLVVGYHSYNLFHDNPLLFWFGCTGLFIILGMILWIIKKVRSKKFLKIQTLQQMKDMDWREFEKFIAFVFRQKGFKAKERKGKNDGGIDIDAIKDGQKYVIQCKKWKDYKVGVVEIRGFVGAMEIEGSDIKGIYITTSKLTQSAQKYVNKMQHKLELWDADTLETYVNLYTGTGEDLKNQETIQVSEHEIICEKCGNSMILREAHKGEHQGKKFYGCSNFPKCRHIVNISQ